MKLKTKQNYFLAPSWEALLKILDTFIRNVYDDLTNIKANSAESLPTAGEDYYGTTYLVSTSGVDNVYLCRKNGSSYEWVQLN